MDKSQPKITMTAYKYDKKELNKNQYVNFDGNDSEKLLNIPYKYGNRYNNHTIFIFSNIDIEYSFCEDDITNDNDANNIMIKRDEELFGLTGITSYYYFSKNNVNNFQIKTKTKTNFPSFFGNYRFKNNDLYYNIVLPKVNNINIFNKIYSIGINYIENGLINFDKVKNLSCKFFFGFNTKENSIKIHLLDYPNSEYYYKYESINNISDLNGICNKKKIGINAGLKMKDEKYSLGFIFIVDVLYIYTHSYNPSNLNIYTKKSIYPDLHFGFI